MESVDSEKVDRDTRQLIAQIARKFYLENQSKIEIAETLSISRFRVARLLEIGRKSGIIRIQIIEPTTNIENISEALQEHLKLNEVRTIETSGTNENIRCQIGEMAAQYLAEVIQENNTIGIAWGRTLAAMTNYLPRLSFSRVVQLTGTVGWDISQSPVEIIRRMNNLSEADAYAIFAPFYLGEASAFIKSQDSIKQVTELFNDIDIAVLSVGSWKPLESQLPPVFPESIKNQLSAAGTRAEVAGIFIDDDGKIVCQDISDQCITIRAEQLMRIPRVVAVAGSPRKVKAIYSLAKSGLIDDLITDRETASLILTMKPIKEVVYKRSQQYR